MSIAWKTSYFNLELKDNVTFQGIYEPTVYILKEYRSFNEQQFIVQNQGQEIGWGKNEIEQYQKGSSKMNLQKQSGKTRTSLKSEGWE